MAGRAAAVSEGVSDVLLSALERPETAFSLSYRLGLDAKVCQLELEMLVRKGAVARRGGDETAVYVRSSSAALSA